MQIYSVNVANNEHELASSPQVLKEELTNNRILQLNYYLDNEKSE